MRVASILSELCNFIVSGILQVNFTVVAHSVGAVSCSREDPPAQEINRQVSVSCVFRQRQLGFRAWFGVTHFIKDHR